MLADTMLESCGVTRACLRSRLLRPLRAAVEHAV